MKGSGSPTRTGLWRDAFLDRCYLSFWKRAERRGFWVGGLALTHSPREGLNIEEPERLAGIFCLFWGKWI
jgi:hypothetical protein